MKVLISGPLGKNIQVRSKRSFPFLPGLFFIGLGLMVVFMPRLLVAAVAAVLVFVGIVLSFLAWKFTQLTRRFEAMAKNVEAQVQVHGLHFGSKSPDDIEVVEEKKIVYH